MPVYNLLALGIIGFWLYFFKVENKDPKNSQVYLHYERAFPLPDLGWIVVSLIIAGIGLLQNAKFGFIMTIASGGGLIFLGLVDVAFNAQNEGYSSDLADSIMNLGINGVCLIFGPISIIMGCSGLKLA